MAPGTRSDDTGWAFNYRYQNLDDSDDDNLSQATSPHVDQHGLSDDAVAELDISVRVDSAGLQLNPWTIARINATTRRTTVPHQVSDKHKYPSSISLNDLASIDKQKRCTSVDSSNERVQAVVDVQNHALDQGCTKIEQRVSSSLPLAAAVSEHSTPSIHSHLPQRPLLAHTLESNVGASFGGPSIQIKAYKRENLDIGASRVVAHATSGQGMSPVFSPKRHTAGSMTSEGRAFRCSESPEPLQSVQAHRRTENSIIGTGADDSLSENIASGSLINSLAVNGKSLSSHFPPLPLAKTLAKPSPPQSSFHVSSLLTSSAGSPPKPNLFKGVFPSPVSSPQSRAHVPAMPRGKLSADHDDFSVAFVSSRRTGGKAENKRDAYSAFPPSPDAAWSTIQSSKKTKARTVNPSSVSQRQLIVISKGFRLPLVKTESAQAKKASMTYRPPPRQTAEQANAGPTVIVFHPHTPESLSRPSLREDKEKARTSNPPGAVDLDAYASSRIPEGSRLPSPPPSDSPIPSPRASGKRQTICGPAAQRADTSRLRYVNMRKRVAE